MVLLTTCLAWIYATLTTAISFYFLSFSYTFLIMGVTIGICGILGIFLLPTQALKMKFPINKKEKDVEDSSIETWQYDVRYKMFFQHKRIFWNLLGAVIFTSSFSFIWPTFSDSLIKSELNCGLALLLASSTFLVGLFATNYAMKFTSPRMVVFGSSMLTCISLYYVGGMGTES